MVRSTVIRPLRALSAPSKVEFEPVHRAKVFEQVAKRLETLIAEQYQPGETIPAERELAKLFGVGRSSIREAIRTLAIAGLVEPRQGTGTVVCRARVRSPLTRRAARHSRTGDLWDARLTIEPALARRAAVQASREDLRKLQRMVSQHQHSVEQGGAAPDKDLQFHHTIALAARNPVMVKVLDVLIKVLRNTPELRPAAEREELEGHRRILAALTRRDASGAERAMRRHLQEIEDTYS